MQQPGVWYELPVAPRRHHVAGAVQRYDLPDGFHLLIGRDVQVRAQLRTLLTDALLWALVIVGAMATAGALLVRSLFRRTLANVSATATAIAAGDFAQRVKLSGRGDEFDQLAETINDMLDRIGRLMDGVRQVSNAIAHDLRTPITRARTRLEDAALHAHSPEELRAAIERATADLDGIVAVFQALLRIAEIEAGSRRSAFCRFDLAPLLADVAELYGAVAEERQVSLVRGRRRSSLPTYGDRDLVQQAVANLVDNAVKFSPAGRRGAAARVGRPGRGGNRRGRPGARHPGRATGHAPPNGSSAARRRAARRALAWASRWCRRWRIAPRRQPAAGGCRAGPARRAHPARAGRCRGQLTCLSCDNHGGVRAWPAYSPV